MAKKTTISHSDKYIPVDSLKALALGTEAYLCYGKEYHKIEIRRRVTRANFPELKKFNFPIGFLQEETEEQYKEYKDFLRRRVKDKQIFIKK